MGTSLTSKVAKSAGWVFSGRIFNRIVDLIKVVVLARLLEPEDFGLFGLVMLIMIMFETFSQTGLNAALVQHKGNTIEYLDTAWTIQVVRGWVIALTLFFGAPLAAWFFKEPRIILPLKVICLSFIIQGFINIETIYYQKDLKFKNQFIYDTTSNAVSLLAGIVMAYLLRSVWALIWANLAGVFTRLVISYTMLTYRPRFQFIKSQYKELFHFGKWMSGYAVASFGWQQLDKFFVGKVLGPIPLGIYQIAQRISDLPISNIASASVNYTFPAYSKMQQGSERLGKAFLDVLETLMSLVLPLVVFTILAAPDIVYGLLTVKWKDSIVPLQILSVAGFFTALDVLSTPLFISVGKPNIEFFKNSLKVIILALTMYPFTIWWGLAGSCMSVVVSSVAILPVWARIRSIANIKWTDIFSRLLFPSACGITTALSVLVSHTLIKENDGLSLAISASLSLFLFIVLTLFIGKFYEKGLYMHIRRTITMS